MLTGSPGTRLAQPQPPKVKRTWSLLGCPATLPPCHRAMLPCHHATVLPRYHATTLPRYHATTSVANADRIPWSAASVLHLPAPLNAEGRCVHRLARGGGKIQDSQ